MAIVTGLVGLLAGFMRLGFIASFISEPVLKGFIVGLALTIIIGQVPKLLGVAKGEGNFFVQTWTVVKELGEVDLPTVIIGLLSLAMVLGAVGTGKSSICSIMRSRLSTRSDYRVAYLDDLAAPMPTEKQKEAFHH